MTRIDERGPPIAVDEAACARLAAVLDREGVVAALLFGSQARGAAGPLSDVDVAVWLDPALDKPTRLDVRIQLAAIAVEALGTTDVQLVVLNDASPLLVHRAVSSGVRLLDRDPRARVRLEARGLLEYLDTKPLREELAGGLRNSIEEGRFGRP